MQTFVVVGLGFGDEGKGTIVDYLTREHKAHTVVRFNGGAQAAHNVVTPDGKHHTFAQFGSGTLGGARTHLSQFMLVNPLDFQNEAEHLESLGLVDPLRLLTISPDALVTTPIHIAANLICERRSQHGSCGKGIGETQRTANELGKDALRAGDLMWQGRTEVKLSKLSNYYSDTLLDTFYMEHGPIDKIAHDYRQFADKVTFRDDSYLHNLQRGGSVLIFEGAQGVLLDEDVGFHPHTTWSRTTSINARELSFYEPTVIGVTRPYMTRHGAGPLVNATFPSKYPEPHNGSHGFQGQFLSAPWDALAMDYAAKCDPVDEVAVTCLDHLHGPWETIWAYDYTGDLPDLSPYFWAEGKRIHQIVLGTPRAHIEAITTRLKKCTGLVNRHESVDADYVIQAIGEVLHAPVTIQSFGMTYRDKKRMSLSWA